MNTTSTVVAADFTVKNGESITIPYTITTNGTSTTPIFGSIGGPMTTTTSGTWTSTGPWAYISQPPDMTDWPPEDIIDWYALDLAKKRPA